MAEVAEEDPRRFQKNQLEVVIAQLKTYNAQTVVDVRVHVEADDGSWTPTKKGLTIRASQLGKLLRALEAVREDYKMTDDPGEDDEDGEGA